MLKLQVFYITLQEGLSKTFKKYQKIARNLYEKRTYMFNEKDILVCFVGTEKITKYVEKVTRLLVAGCIIVSGLVSGVDSIATLATIEDVE